MKAEPIRKPETVVGLDGGVQAQADAWNCLIDAMLETVASPKALSFSIKEVRKNVPLVGARDLDRGAPLGYGSQRMSKQG